MRLGLFMMPVHPPVRPMHEVMAEDMEKCLLADRLGFDEMFLGEHFSAWSEPYPSPLMFMAALVHRTKNLDFGTGVISLPNRHPALVAGEVAQFDHLSRGRFIFGIGTGSLISDFELLGNGDPALRNRMLIESIHMIEKIWSQDPPYDITGEFWSTKIERTVSRSVGIGFIPKPYQQPRPPICVTAASPNSQTVRIAGHRGWGPISSGFLTAQGVATHWDMLRKGAAETHRAPDPSQWRVARCIHVAASDAEARDRVTSAQSSYQHYFAYFRKNSGRARPAGGAEGAARHARRRGDGREHSQIAPHLRLAADRPRQARRLPRPGPARSAACSITGVDWTGPNEAWERESLRRLAEEVMPRLNQHAAAKAAE